MAAAEFYTPAAGWNVIPKPVIQWISCSNGNYPNNAVDAGYDAGTRLYVARANHQGALLPGKLHPSHRTCYVAWGGKEHAVSNYEVLVAPPGAVRWIHSSQGQMVSNALVGGRSEQGEQLFVGRCNHSGTQTPGKIHPSHRVCYIPYGGKEIGMAQYEILIKN